MNLLIGPLKLNSCPSYYPLPLNPIFYDDTPRSSLSKEKSKSNYPIDPLNGTKSIVTSDSNEFFFRQVRGTFEKY